MSASHGKGDEHAGSIRPNREAFIDAARNRQNINNYFLMKTLLKLESAAVLVACYIATLALNHGWWLFFVLLLLPDISMVGYAVNNKWGALLYNLFHHQGVAILVIGIGWYTEQPMALLAGIILLGHSAMDRMLGYGLKYASGFQDTHLGKMGKRQFT